MSRDRQRRTASQTTEDVPAWMPRPLLQALHLLTRDGALNADARRKLKQVQHLLGLMEPAVADALARFPEPVIADCGAGKSYLGFLLAARFLAPSGRGRVVAIETRTPLGEAARELASSTGLDPRMEFISAAVDQAPLPPRVHLVTALHACDTATDDALLLALRYKADHVAVVPCCQAEVARQLRETTPSDPALATLAAHPLHARELGSHLTNVVRALVLEAHGYQVTVTELVGWEHSLKNELILGRRIQNENRAAQQRLDELLTASGIRPKLIRDLEVAAADQRPPA